MVEKNIQDNVQQEKSFWGTPIKDEKGRVVAHQDEFGRIWTSQGKVSAISGCLTVIIGLLALVAGCTLHMREEAQKRRVQNETKNTKSEMSATISTSQENSRRFMPHFISR